MTTHPADKKQTDDQPVKVVTYRPMSVVLGAVLLTGLVVFGLWSGFRFERTTASDLTFTDHAHLEATRAALVGIDFDSIYTDPQSLPWAHHRTERMMIFSPRRALGQTVHGLREADWDIFFDRGLIFYEYAKTTDPDYRSGRWSMPVAQPLGRLIIHFDTTTHTITDARFVAEASPPPSVP